MCSVYIHDTPGPIAKPSHDNLTRIFPYIAEDDTDGTLNSPDVKIETSEVLVSTSMELEVETSEELVSTSMELEVETSEVLVSTSLELEVETSEVPGSLECWVYVGHPNRLEIHRKPTARYINMVLAGADCLPEQYVEMLSQVETLH